MLRQAGFAPVEITPLGGAFWNLGLRSLYLLTHFPRVLFPLTLLLAPIFGFLVPFLCFYPFAAGIYLTGAASFLHLSHWPPTLLEGTLIYGGSVAILAIELAYRRYQKETSSGNAVAG